MLLASFIICLLVFVAIGVMSFFHAQQTSDDYLLASRNTKPWLVALSAIATTNSGYMFVGQIGFTYAVGLHSMWLAIGWVVGDFLTSLFVHKNLRSKSHEMNSRSFVTALSSWQGQDLRWFRILGGLVTVGFLSTYAAAQLNAGSKALNVLIGWDYNVGAIIGAAIVVTYCMAGGIRASIWTDAAQSFVMMFAMILMAVMTIIQVGGLSEFGNALGNISPEYMNLFPAENMNIGPVIGPALFVLGWFMAGVGVIGQPHIMVRFMAMDDPKNMMRTRLYYYGWYASFYALTITTAMAARLLIPDTNEFDAELALPTLAQELLPAILVGLVLAGLFAATISTADSQILCCTAAMTSDLAPEKLSGYKINKVVTITVTAIALLIALYGPDSVFDLVLIAWSGLGAAFAPTLILLVLRRQLSQRLMITMMISGILAVIAWRQAGLDEYMYEIFPGIMVGFLIFGLARIPRLFK